MCFRDPIRVPRIEHRVPRIKEHRVPTDLYRVPNIFLEQTWFCMEELVLPFCF